MLARPVIDLFRERSSWRDPIVAMSRVMQTLLALVERVGASTLPVLILGETGSGKEVIARALHDVSGRSGPLVAVNCAALPAALAESELFGHVRGAFTGADGTFPGLLRASDRGTLFLDEVADLDLTVQAKLLRVIEDGAVRMVGATASNAVDLRIVAATCQGLGAAVAERRFREDLYHRLAGVTLTVPPLRDRPEDIEPLLRRFLDEAGARGFELPGETIRCLKQRPWPGNVRELRQAVRRAMVLGDEELLQEPVGLDASRAAENRPALETWLVGRCWEDIERDILTWAIAHYGGVRAAAAALERPRSTVADRARRFRAAGTSGKP